MYKLKKIRHDLKLNQTDMASLLGISYQCLRRYETGLNKKMKPFLESKLSELSGSEYHYDSNKEC